MKKLLFGGPLSSGGTGRLTFDPSTGNPLWYDEEGDYSACCYRRARDCATGGFSSTYKMLADDVDFAKTYTHAEGGCYYFNENDRAIYGCPNEATELEEFDGDCEECLGGECCEEYTITISGAAGDFSVLNGTYEYPSEAVTGTLETGLITIAVETSPGFTCWRVVATYEKDDGVDPPEAFTLLWLSSYFEGTYSEITPCDVGNGPLECVEDGSPYDMEVNEGDPSTVTVECSDEGGEATHFMCADLDCDALAEEYLFTCTFEVIKTIVVVDEDPVEEVVCEYDVSQTIAIGPSVHLPAANCAWNYTNPDGPGAVGPANHLAFVEVRDIPIAAFGDFCRWRAMISVKCILDNNAPVGFEFETTIRIDGAMTPVGVFPDITEIIANPTGEEPPEGESWVFSMRITDIEVS